MKKIVKYVVLGALLLLIAGYSLYYHYLTRQHYNDTYVNGNTAGNLYNSGLFCEDEEYIYFSNASDDNRLYRMKKDGSEIKKMNNDTAAYINVDDNYLYYIRTGGGAESSFSFLNVNTHSLCRIRKDAKGDVTILDEAPALYASLVGNYIYYLHYDTKEATTLYRIKIDGEEKEQISVLPFFTCSTDGQYIFYNGLENDHNIYKYDTASKTQALLYEGNCWMPVVDGDTVYFMDCINNYQLAKVDLTTGRKTILCTDRVDCFNVYRGVIYFQRNGENSALCSVRTDGSDYKVLSNGNYTEINAAGNYIYFKDFTTKVMFRLSVSSDTITVFTP